MPRLPINYANSIIYRLVCKDVNVTDSYVGSTTQFTVRKAKHKSATYNEKDRLFNSLLYTTIRANGGFENWSMLEVEKVNCETRRELEVRERHFIEFYKSNLNFNMPREDDDKNLTRRTYMRDYKRKKYAENADVILDKNKNYYYKKKFNLPLEDISKYGNSLPIVSKAKHHLDELRRLYPEILKTVVEEYI